MTFPDNCRSIKEVKLEEGSIVKMGIWPFDDRDYFIVEIQTKSGLDKNNINSVGTKNDIERIIRSLYELWKKPWR